jgi:nucleoside-diphosphate-sugar epimerase
MRIFVAGATGVIGSRVVPLLVDAGHIVAGLTRTPGKADLIRAARAEPVVCDVYDADALTAAVQAFRPDLIIHELTDLPDDADELPARRSANARIRVEGTRNLLAAAAASDCNGFIAESVAWPMPPGEGADAVTELEQTVLAYGVSSCVTASSTDLAPITPTRCRQIPASTSTRQPPPRWRRWITQPAS